MNVEFTDTNILVYAFGDEPDKRQTASALITRLDRAGSGAMSTQVAAEFCAVVTRKLKLPARVSATILEGFAHWRIYCPQLADIIQAVKLQERHRLSFWDSMMIYSAIQSGAQILWTEDLNDGQRFGDLTVRNPFATTH